MSPTYLQTTRSNIRDAQQYGHAPVSIGCGSFRCQKCNLSAYLDTEPDPRWFTPCVPTTFTSAAAIRSHASSRDDGNGRLWFSKDTMRWHATRLERGIAYSQREGRWYFILSNDPGASVGHPCRRFAVCVYDPRTNRVETVCTMEDQRNTAPDARAEMNRRAES